MAKIVQVNVSNGGMPKRAVPEVRVMRSGLEGDRSNNRKYHGGEDRAVCLFDVEGYEWLREQGIDLKPGDMGENLTTEGLDLQQLAVGDRLGVGEVVIEISQVRTPCNQLKMWNARFPKIILGRSGWMARVITEGRVRAGDEVAMIPREGDVHERSV